MISFLIKHRCFGVLGVLLSPLLASASPAPMANLGLNLLL